MAKPDELTRRIAARHERERAAGMFKLILFASILLVCVVMMIVSLLRG